MSKLNHLSFFMLLGFLLFAYKLNAETLVACPQLFSSVNFTEAQFAPYQTTPEGFSTLYCAYKKNRDDVLYVNIMTPTYNCQFEFEDNSICRSSLASECTLKCEEKE